MNKLALLLQDENKYDHGGGQDDSANSDPQNGIAGGSILVIGVALGLGGLGLGFFGNRGVITGIGAVAVDGPGVQVVIKEIGDKKIEGVMPPQDRVASERYAVGDKLKVKS